MNRLTRLLLAGTIVPGLAIIPVTHALAQAPDTHVQGRKEKGARAASGAALDAKAEGHGEGHRGTKKEAKGVSKPGAVEAAADDKQAGSKRDGIKAEDAKATDEKPGAAKAKRMGAKAKPENAPIAAADSDGSDAARAPNKGQRDAADTAMTPKGKSARKKDAAQRMQPGARDADANPRTPPAPPSAAGRNEMPPQDADRGAPNNAMRGGQANGRMTSGARPTEATDTKTVTKSVEQSNTQERRDTNQATQTREGMRPAGAVAAGAAAGFAGGFMAATTVRHIEEIHQNRTEVTEDGRTYIREPGRTIVRDGDRAFIVHDENERFRELGYDVRRKRFGQDYVDVIDRPGGIQILTYTDPTGRMLRRVRRLPDGRMIVLIDNGFGGRIRPYQDDIVVLPPPPMRLPPERYIVDYRGADEALLYATLTAPPVAAPPRRYTLDQVRYSPDVRNYVRSIDINTINFDTGSWEVPQEASGKLQALAGAIKQAVGRNPNSVFLIEGYTDAVGNVTDNLSLSDRRAQSVAAIMTKSFKVPPENLTTQGYGEQNLKEKTDGPSAINRRVVVRNVTQLLAANAESAPSNGEPAPDQ